MLARWNQQNEVLGTRLVTRIRKISLFENLKGKILERESRKIMFLTTMLTFYGLHRISLICTSSGNASLWKMIGSRFVSQLLFGTLSSLTGCYGFKRVASNIKVCWKHLNICRPPTHPCPFLTPLNLAAHTHMDSGMPDRPEPKQILWQDGFAMFQCPVNWHWPNPRPRL